ncbi:MAG: DEAD/DEAH box helicase, partial [Verrucomicrobiota bacterium]|nr:DEAD/DEAH box helicase [Verrucomicrobiota bacterium]
MNPVTAKLKPTFLIGSLSAGFLYRNTDKSKYLPNIFPESNHEGFVLICDHEFFNDQKLRHQTQRVSPRSSISQVDQLLDFSELADGDLLVHLQHGICLFHGLTKLKIQGGTKEVISVEFAANMTIHVPLHESHLLTRYVGLTKSSPKLGKIGSSSWDKTRRAAEIATLDYAAELLNLHARRDQSTGHAFPPDSPWQKNFEDAFTFSETPDQLTAIHQTKQDMEKPTPMDRLICGDVGFGKTEVAIRAALKAVLAGKQVALLAPTTVLCQQHYNTLRERMSDFPVIIEQVSRFHTTKENRQSLAQLAAGKIDIVVGTHRLLSKDVHFQNLGLLIVDEEQRFGVKQKDSIKQLRAEVDILTLSATPIPRTLYLALSGARSMSVIETAPINRRPIKTIVKSYDPELVKQAIEFETKRNGQVYYLHNKVTTIDAVAQQIRDMLPALKVAVGHGQMEDQALEEVMTQFVAGQYDVLVCTTIIESGIDIPNCNTLIIEGADKFGLAQLYQIRGRVGRFKRQAYAYLLLHRHATL